MLKIQNPLEVRLPKLRGDLEIYRGPDDGDGTPTYNIHDPVIGTYYKISWVEAEVLKQMQQGINVKELLKRLHETTTLRLTPEDVIGFVKQLELQGLLEQYQHFSVLEDKWKKQKPSWFVWLAMNYLFFKIPLFKPDRFLKATLPYVRPFLSAQAMMVYLSIIVVGLGLVLVNWSNFINTFTYFFNIKGIIVYSLAIMLTKLFHELGHAYTCKKYGLHIPTMGIAILLLWPIPYTDATDAWKLHNRRQRLIISAAGIIVELVIAGICTILWTLTSPGLMQSFFFVLASVNWVTSIFINLSPAMRYDGYYIASDLLGVENLQSRAFNLLRYEFYKIVAGADLPDVEPKLSPSKKKLVLALAVYTWFYRLFLYTAVALFVYFKFTKVLGVLLFLLEIAIFFVWPVVYEIQFVHKIRDKIKWNWRLRIVSSLIIAFLIWFIVPWPIKASSTAITIPSVNYAVVAPLAGTIEKIYVKRGDEIGVGKPIIAIKSEELENKNQVLEKEIAILQKKLDITELSDKNLPFYLETQTQLIQKQAELEGNQNHANQGILNAKVPGQVYEWDEWLRPGVQVKENQKLGQVAALSNMDVVAYVSEIDAAYLKPGDTVQFRPVSLQGSFTGKVMEVSPVRTQKLLYPQLASTNQGEIPVNKDMEPVESFYAVQVHLDDSDDLRFGLTGWITFWGPWRSRAFLLAESVFLAILRQTGG